ncbi:hypothetical protein EDD18DRAFT_1200926 [Armillaria luteobubalina]|uniref:DUF6534 domain-containing protein n=1 Tax=Armillaria luteobubalina TaxID=153913 RepID=A0AA39TE31_9AGAR|nr:hypothetical protein EDD18DRAFT_1200926 [Armillaria luteobubalina]
MSLQPSKAILGETLGALYVGATLAAVFFGITNLQVVQYYKNYPKDWWLFRYSVALLWVLDALHLASSTHGVYYYLIDMFGNLQYSLTHSVWSFKLMLVLNIAILLYVQGLYAIRLWKLGRHFHKIFPWFVFLAVAISLGAGLYMVHGIFVTLNFSHISGVKTPIYTFFCTVAASDFVIALMMCYYLHKSRAATNFPTTASLLLGLMRLVVVSGLATSVCSLIILIAFIVWPDTLIFIGIGFILPKLYVNSLLAMLNYRPEQLDTPSAENSRNNIPAVFRITPHSSEGSTAETDMSIPLSEVMDIRSFDGKVGRNFSHEQV